MEARKRFAYFEREGWGAGCDVGTYMGEPMVSRFGGYNTIRSHLSMLPRRRIGVVAQTNGPAAGGATDIIAALAYDLEAGRANARALASARVDSLIAQYPLHAQALLQAILYGDHASSRFDARLQTSLVLITTRPSARS